MKSATITTIPDWNPHGVLPPIAPGMAVNSTNRSPYRVGITEIIERFSYSPERIAILEGFLRFRAELHQQGLVFGFQWLDGSFLENIEDLEGRYPNDLDVVTFFAKLTPEKQRSLVDNFNTGYLKTECKIDNYFAQADHADYVENSRLTAYWCSMWSHRRDGSWKGFLQVDLDKINDGEATNILNNKKGGVQ